MRVNGTMSLSILDLLSVLSGSPTDQISWFQQRGLLASHMTCPSCSLPIRNDTKNNRDISTETVHRWQYPDDGCKRRIGIPTGSFFEKSKLSLQKWIVITHWWLRHYPVNAAAEKAKVVERMYRKSQHHQGKPPQSDHLVYDRNTTLALGIMTLVPRRDAATLLPIIQQHVRPGTTTWSDEWDAYRNVQSFCQSQNTRLSTTPWSLSIQQQEYRHSRSSPTGIMLKQDERSTGDHAVR